MRPIVKWAGGKTRLLPALAERVPKTMRTYAEPFAGGAALFFELAEHTDRFERAILCDQNPELVICYQQVRDDVEGVIRALKPYVYERTLFYETRDLDPAKLSPADRAARLIFLNRTCYNGLWRVNARGKFNVPFGRYKNPRIQDPDGLRAASRALRRAEILHDDFATVTSSLKEGDFAYLDPPYVPLSKTADFTAYSQAKFGAKDQERLVREVLAMKKRGVQAMISNAHTPETVKLYEKLAQHTVRMPRMINANTERRGEVTELLATTWANAGPPPEESRRARRAAT